MSRRRPGARAQAEVQPAIALGIVEELPELIVDALAGRGRQRSVEGAMWDHPAPVVLGLRVVRHLGHVTLEPREILGRHARDRETQCGRLERDSDDGELLEILGRHRRDTHSAVGLRLDQALALKHP